MNKPNSRRRLATLPKKPLMLLAGAILLVGIAVTWWFMHARRPPPPHPETALFRHIEEPRVVLADVFRSYDSEAAVATPLEAAGLTVIRKVQQRPEDPRYPLRRMATFTVLSYKHLDCEGTLILEFFNDRLMEADFRPDDAARYAPRLRRAYPILRSTGTGHAEATAAPLRMWSSVELAKSKVGRSLGTEGMVLWQDLRLIAQRDDWDARYGTIPIPSNR
ncbi:MAG: hypothetical protein Q7J29_08405 [Stagnimonas sp.]|nr:hypothetical protein [Stagnimonas sp.]